MEIGGRRVEIKEAGGSRCWGGDRGQVGADGGGGGCSGYRGTGWFRWDTGHGLEIGRAGGWR